MHVVYTARVASGQYDVKVMRARYRKHTVRMSGSSGEDSLQALAKMKILIIEYEPDVVEMLQRQLDRAGNYKTISAPDGSNGINEAREQMPGLIVLDLMLPRLSGLEVCRLLKTDSATRQIPVKMRTAKAEGGERIVCPGFGAGCVLAEPLRPP